MSLELSYTPELGNCWTGRISTCRFWIQDKVRYTHNTFYVILKTYGLSDTLWVVAKEKDSDWKYLDQDVYSPCSREMSNYLDEFLVKKAESLNKCSNGS